MDLMPVLMAVVAVLIGLAIWFYVLNPVTQRFGVAPKA